MMVSGYVSSLLPFEFLFLKDLSDVLVLGTPGVEDVPFLFKIILKPNYEHVYHQNMCPHHQQPWPREGKSERRFYCQA